MIILAFGDLTIVVDVYIKGFKYMIDHIALPSILVSQC